MANPADIPSTAPCWIELYTSDTDAAERFFGELFGWTAKHMGPDFGGYINFLKDDKMVAGCMANPADSDCPNIWTTYFKVNNAEDASAKVVANSGTVEVPAMEVMDLGSMAVVVDSGKVGFGLWQPGTHLGFETKEEIGGPAWFELQTVNFDKSMEFYRNTFGWDIQVISDQPGMRYAVATLGEYQVAGILDASDNAPADWNGAWVTYFETDDIDKSLAKVESLGGSITIPAMPTPYGQLAQVTDHSGLTFKLRQL